MQLLVFQNHFALTIYLMQNVFEKRKSVCSNSTPQQFNNSTPPIKVLVLRFSSIGDLVLTTPVVRCLKQQTGAEVHFLTKKSFLPVLEANPYIDRLHTFDKDLSELLPTLRRERFDWVIDLHHNLRSWRVKWALGAPSRSFHKLNFEKWLLVNLHINRLPNVHIVERYMKTVAHLGVSYDGLGLDYHIPTGHTIDPTTIDPSLVPGSYVAFAIGATHATKRLPPEKIAGICAQLAPMPVLLLGGKTEAAYSAAIATSAGTHVIDACGRLSLHQSADLVRQAAKVFTHDTGLMHIAAAFSKPIVSFWGSTVPAFGMYPFYPQGKSDNITVEVENLPCRPCSKIGYAQCPKGHFACMNQIRDEGWGMRD